MVELIRENLNKSEIKLKIGNEIKIIYDEKNFCKNNNIPFGGIRIHKKDYDLLKPNRKYLTHFNLHKSFHKVGEIYVLQKILKSGYYISDENYKLPLIDLKNNFIVKCIECNNEVKYNDIKKSVFKFSLPNIKNIKELKKEIYWRYSKSMPKLSKKEIENLGVSITKLEIIGKTNSDFKNLTLFDTLDKNSKGSTRVGFGKGIVDAAKTNKNIVALTADLKPSVQLTQFEKLYPKRFFEMGISEQNMASAATGMTINNKIPFITSFAAFNPGRNWDQIRVSICYSNANVKILGSHAGLTTGPDGATHQALEDIAITRVLPNMTVIVPCDEEEARQATIASANHIGPVYLRVSREKSINIFNKKSKFEIGKAQILEKGNDVTIIACGITLQFALEAKQILKTQGISATIINLSTIKPLDTKTLLNYAKKTKAIVTIEEHQVTGGMGSAISEYFSQNYPIPIEIIGVEDSFGESGEGYELLEKYNISTKEIIKRVKKVLKRKNQ